MPRLMEKNDWTRTVSDLEKSDSVWQEDVTSDSDSATLSLPGTGAYRVFIVKIDATAAKPKCKSARELIGYGARFHKPRTTEEWMKELREGEEL